VFLLLLPFALLAVVAFHWLLGPFHARLGFLWSIWFVALSLIDALLQQIPGASAIVSILQMLDDVTLAPLISSYSYSLSIIYWSRKLGRRWEPYFVKRVRDPIPRSLLHDSDMGSENFEENVLLEKSSERSQTNLLSAAVGLAKLCGSLTVVLTLWHTSLPTSLALTAAWDRP